MLLLLCMMHTYGKKRIISCLCSCLYIWVEITLDVGTTGRHIQVLVAECMRAIEGEFTCGVSRGWGLCEIDPDLWQLKLEGKQGGEWKTLPEFCLRRGKKVGCKASVADGSRWFRISTKHQKLQSKWHWANTNIAFAKVSLRCSSVLPPSTKMQVRWTEGCRWICMNEFAYLLSEC